MEQELVDKAYALCLAIEKIKECSWEQTTASAKASGLLRALQDHFDIKGVNSPSDTKAS